MQPAAFYPIVPDVDWLARIVPTGISTIQLRIKDKPRDVVRTAIAAALDLTRAHNCQLIVNDYWREAIDLGADFIHLGQEDLAAADMAAIRRKQLRIGISTHSEAEREIALACDPDYIALGPIYQTRLKAMAWAPQGLYRISEWKRAIGKTPLVAIGGITPERAPGVLNAGADSVAVITDFITHPNPVTRITTWLDVVRGHRGASRSN